MREAMYLSETPTGWSGYFRNEDSHIRRDLGFALSGLSLKQPAKLLFYSKYEETQHEASGSRGIAEVSTKRDGGGMQKKKTGEVSQRSQPPPGPNFRAIYQGYSPSLLSDTIWKAGFLSSSIYV